MRLPNWKFVAYGMTTVVTAVTIKSSSNSSMEVKQSIHIPLQSYFNNRGFAKAPGDAEFNSNGQSYPAQNLPSPGTYTSTKTNISYLFPGYQEGNKSDNLLLVGQTLKIPEDNYFSVQLLLAGDAGTATGDAIFTYSDNSTTITEIRTQSFFTFLSIYKGEIVMPSYYTNVSTNYNTTHIFEWIGSLNPRKKLTSIEFPDTSNDTSRIHVFSMSLFKQSGIQVQNLRPTQKTSGNGIQTVELVVNNAGPEWISGEGVEISILAPGIKTVSPGKIKRLRPGDQKKVDVGIMGSAANVTAEVVFQGVNTNSSVIFKDVSFGLEKWTPDSKSLTKHESPQWYNDAKFGIFIHWGVYAVPGWGNSSTSEVYAEWYGWYNRHRAADRADIYDYELRTYGPDLNYDDFFPNFTASLFDPKEWVDLFDEAGAKYFVLTSKHHDGFSLFDTKQTSNRSALHYGPYRDVFKELFDAAKLYYPEMHRAGYYSMTEWWNPDFGPYGFAEREGNTSTTWPGILATNPYTGLTEPYIGHIPVNDYLTDLQLPQMNMLAYEYESEIMWCDTGGPNKTAEFAASWYNWATENGRQVVLNNRCGIAESDFDTPEYTTFSSVSERKWESNQGMDPFSYGYNRATPPSAYMNASKLITTLVDMVSKNGNLLLDIGPKADGTIDETEVATLKEAGAWIRAHGEGIYNTTYWFIMAENEDVRFTQTVEAFYILSLTPPTETFILDVPLPILQGDSVSLIGFGNDTELDWEFYGSGIKITVPEELISAGKYCWVMKIKYIS